MAARQTEGWQKIAKDSKSTMQDIFIANQGEHKMCRMHMQKSREMRGHIRTTNRQGGIIKTM